MRMWMKILHGELKDWRSENVNAIELNCKVVKKVATPHFYINPPFQVYPPFLANNFVPQVIQGGVPTMTALQTSSQNSHTLHVTSCRNTPIIHLIQQLLYTISWIPPISTWYSYLHQIQLPLSLPLHTISYKQWHIQSFLCRSVHTVNLKRP